MVVLQSNIPGRHDDPYDIMTAMQGFDTIPVTVPKDPNISPRFGDPKSGPDKRMTTQPNTTISAIAVIQSPPAGTYEIDVYHNSFAVNPVDPEWLRQPGIRHWKIPEGSTNSRRSVRLGLVISFFSEGVVSLPYGVRTRDVQRCPLTRNCSLSRLQILTETTPLLSQ